MATALPDTGLQLRSLVKASGELELSLASVPIVAPGPNEVLVRIGGAPINPAVSSARLNHPCGPK